jgi:hypothetical protein
MSNIPLIYLFIYFYKYEWVLLEIQEVKFE